MTAYQDLARDLWPQAAVSGNGRFAHVRSCGGTTVELRSTKQQPRSAHTDCDCAQVHELVVLDE